MKPPFELPDVKILKCRECGVDVKVNVTYPIEDVGCNSWYCPKTKEDKDVFKF